MPKMIQIRNVPDDLHRTLKIKAAEAGLTLSDYLLQMAEREASQVGWDVMLARLRTRRGASFGDAAVDIIRKHRGPLPE